MGASTFSTLSVEMWGADQAARPIGLVYPWLAKEPGAIAASRGTFADERQSSYTQFSETVQQITQLISCAARSIITAHRLLAVKT